jgi:hypothetical protein
MQQNSNVKLQIDWDSLIIEQEKSGLSQKDFCNQRGLVLSQFVYHRCSRNKSKPTQVAEPILQPVKIVSEEASAPCAEIRLSLPNGFQFSFPCSLDTTQLKQLVEVLLSC